MKEAWVEITKMGYASPAAAPYIRPPRRSVATGALELLDPFRSSLPALYRGVPSPLADVVALQSDWAMFGMDFTYVVGAGLPRVDERQESLFDRDEFKR